MKYNAPYGSADPNAPYVDRNTAGSAPGSKVPAAAIEHPQREIMSVIEAAGIVPDGKKVDQLLEAIGKLIDAATGGAGDENYVLMTQARANLPIFPHVKTSTGTIPVVSAGDGQVRLPAGYNFLHRGIFNVVTATMDFPTQANRIYHLRWNPTDGFSLKDLANATYNPSALADASPFFDSSYDDMLVSRVMTSGGNVATITNLVNFDRLALSERKSGAASGLSAGTLAYSATQIVEWARTPTIKSVAGSITADATPAASMDHMAAFVDTIVITRYTAQARVRTDWQSSATFASSGAYLDFNLGA
ncbi:hypothetical protein IB237_23240 [Agrobacterium sp. AGB01]|uniref:hypothetical protein n=1 Tax=Agrobacterium sp. AGB01 TaxID=2769302 RepID=UPI00177AD9B0|nr:hypothetical protein [Agrobacterium sp. AGB01]MBD9390119.1 hypothetical protein [Agrobacterium sp. AGB01]